MTVWPHRSRYSLGPFYRHREQLGTYPIIGDPCGNAQRRGDLRPSESIAVSRRFC